MNTCTPYRPAAYYLRATARCGTDREVREALLRVVAEREQLRAWVRAQGFIPPVWQVPEAKCAGIISRPLTAWQREAVERTR